MPRYLNRRLDHKCNRYDSRMLPGARRPRPVDPLRAACRALNLAVRLSKRMAKRDPHLFGPRAADYFRDTLRLEAQQRETEAALRKVYGPPKPGDPPFVSTLWTDRYFHTTPEAQRIFRKWFKEHYGPR